MRQIRCAFIINAALFRVHCFCSNCSVRQLESAKSICKFSAPEIHAKAIKNGSTEILHARNYILSRYVKSSNLLHAQQLFDEFPERDVRSWTILISGLSRTGSYKLALDLFTQLRRQGITPNQFTFSSIFKCCARANELRIGKAIHGWILSNGVVLDMALSNSLLDFYVKCWDFDHARRLFELMKAKDTLSWNIMMGSYFQTGDMESSRELFSQLPFKDAASWNTIIDGHLKYGCERIAVELLYQMVKVGPAFTHVTFSIAFVLASSVNSIDLGKQIHAKLLRIGMHDDSFINNSLLDMYCKCGKLEKAMSLFQNLPKVVKTGNSKLSYGTSLANSISLSSVISGYIQNGRIEGALKAFIFMVSEHVEADNFTLTSLISACANAGLLEFGQLIHAYILKTGQEPDVFLSSSMIDMYAKCGRLRDASLIFKQAKIRNVVLWTAAISCYALHGQGKEAIHLFKLMQNEGVVPNEVTFIGVLTACSRAGLFDEGCSYFRFMKDIYAINPQVEHYTCMVDLLGRAGRLNEIRDFIYNNNISHLSAVWKAFLSACHVHKSVEMARWVSEKLFELEPTAAGPYVLLSNTCASDHRWDEAAMLKGMMQERGVKKQPGQSWIL